MMEAGNGGIGAAARTSAAKKKPLEALSGTEMASKATAQCLRTSATQSSTGRIAYGDFPSGYIGSSSACAMEQRAAGIAAKIKQTMSHDTS